MIRIGDCLPLNTPSGAAFEMVTSITPRLERASRQTRDMHSHVVVAEVAIQQRGLDVLPLARPFAMEQCGHYCGQRRCTPVEISPISTCGREGNPLRVRQSCFLNTPEYAHPIKS